MTAESFLRILTPSGTKVLDIAQNPASDDPTLGGYFELASSNVVNGYGACAFSLDGFHQVLPSLVERAQIEVWRADAENGIGWYREWSGLFLDEERFYDNGRHVFVAKCFSDAFILQDREVLWSAGTLNRSIFTALHAETIMKTLVHYNLHADATVANGRKSEGGMSGLSYAADTLAGNVIDWACAWDNLLETLQKMSSVAGGDFDLIKTGAAAWEFRWYTGQRGTDRSAEVVFSLERGNMAAPKYTCTRSGKKTVVLVGGQDTGAARQTARRTGNGYTATNIIEQFVQANTQSASAASLNASGDQKLWELRDRETFSFDLLQTPDCLYGKHFFVGDVVTAKYLGIQTTPKITQVSVSRAVGGAEHIKAVLTYG
jgi:hypothetical protein